MRQPIILVLLLAATWASAQNNIVGYEYWFDQNDATRTYAQVVPGSAIDVLEAVPVAGLSVGTHSLYMRLKDSNGQWGSVQWRLFAVEHPSVQAELVALRHWSGQGTSPPSDLTEVPIPDPAQYIDILTDLDLCTIRQTGNTRVFFQLKDSHGRWSSVIARNINIDVVGPPSGTPVISGETGVCPDSLYTYTAQASGGAWYTWTLPSGWTGNSTGPSITVTTPGTVVPGTITVVAHNSCGESTQGTITVGYQCTNSIQDQYLGNGITLFPNPTTGQFTLRLPEGMRPRHLTLFDATGRAVLAQPMANTSGPIDIGPITVYMSGLGNGLYLVQVELADGARLVERVVKE